MSSKKTAFYTSFTHLILFALFSITVIGMILLFPKITDENQANYWTELFKIVFSALISAFVAYFVSALQLKSAAKKEESKELSTNLKRIRLLVLEIKDNKEVIDIVKENNFPERSTTILKDQISCKILEMYFDELIIKEATLESIMKYNKKIALFCSLNHTEMNTAYNDLEKSIKSVIFQLEETLEQTKNELNSF